MTIQTRVPQNVKCKAAALTIMLRLLYYTVSNALDSSVSEQKIIILLTRVELANERSLSLTVHVFHLVPINIERGP